jgi:hypothetical protein
MVEKHKSDSYWKERFAALKQYRIDGCACGCAVADHLRVCGVYDSVFFVEQYRGSIKLGPIEYSDSEKLTKQALEDRTRFLYRMMQGSLTSLRKAITHFLIRVIVCVYMKKTLRSVFNVSGRRADPLYTVKEDGFIAGG